LPLRQRPEAKQNSKGDRVIIYMPAIPEAAIAMLACARIGAIHSVVFGGFSADRIRDRMWIAAQPPSSRRMAGIGAAASFRSSRTSMKPSRAGQRSSG
jgi:Acyl-coenzyme A synthetases/AMP-(fatty) acid ligases